MSRTSCLLWWPEVEKCDRAKWDVSSELSSNYYDTVWDFDRSHFGRQYNFLLIFWKCFFCDGSVKSMRGLRVHHLEEWGWLERIELRKTNVMLFPNASVIGIRQQKFSSPSVGLKGIFKFTMHGSLKAWEGYPRWLERIEQRITDLDIYLKASAKGIRRKKCAFTCLTPRGIFKFTMHVYLWS